MNPIIYAVIITAVILGSIFTYTYYGNIRHAWSARLLKNKKLKTIRGYKHSKMAIGVPAGASFPEISILYNVRNKPEEWMLDYNTRRPGKNLNYKTAMRVQE